MSAGTMASGPLAALARGVAIAGCVSPAEAGRRRGEEGGRSSTSGTARGGGRRGEPQLMKKHLEGFRCGGRQGQCKDRGGCSPLRKRDRRRAKQQRALTRKQILIL